jgi:hypothetical protein
VITFPSCRRRLVSVALLGCLGLGTQTAAATVAADRYDDWASTMDTDDGGHRVCGVRTRMDGGGDLQVMVIDGAVQLIVRDIRWHMHYGDSFRVAIEVDNHRFGGDGQAVDSRTLMVTSLSGHFLRQFIDGVQMVTSFGGVRRSVSLVGSNLATGDMRSCLAAAQEGLPS